jgi:ABC-type xylose transport system substrate-binding protein
MTVWKDTRLSATNTARAAVALLKGGTPKTTGKSNGVPAFIFKPVSITKLNYKQLFNGYLKRKDVCVGAYAKYCK